jgi:hypothetical protein
MKRRENKKVLVCLDNKPLEQVNNINYLGIIIDSKLKFREHIIHASRKCSMLIPTLAKSANLSWKLKHEVPQTIYEETTLPTMLYGAPVWLDAMGKKLNKAK